MAKQIKKQKCSWCKECVKKYDKNRQSTEQYKADKCVKQRAIRKRNRQFILDYLEGKSCIDCGESRTPCLQFDHEDGTDKLGTVSNMMTHGLTALLEEIQKCVVRCANCHSIKTAEQQGWYKRYD